MKALSFLEYTVNILKTVSVLIYRIDDVADALESQAHT